MKITYHLGDKKIVYNTTAVPPIGTTVELEMEGPSDAIFTVVDVRFKLFLCNTPNIYEEVDVFLSLDAAYTIENILLKEIEYTSTSTQNLHIRSDSER